MTREQGNIATVRQAYESVAKGDVQSLLNTLGNGVEWRLPEMESVPFAGTWRGHDGVEEFFSRVHRAQETVEFRVERFVAQDDKVVVLGRFFMRVKATGRDAISDWAHVWTLQNGEITHFHEYVDTAAVSRAHLR
jgi:uncharacterized protein